MPIKKIVAVFLFVFVLFGCSQKPLEVVSPQIIPTPSTQIINDGKFVFNSSIGVSFPQNLKISGQFLRSFIEEGSKIELQNSNEVEFIFDTEIKNVEGYTLDIQPNKIEIRASSDQGAFYAVQSLRQLLPPEFENGSYELEQVAISCVSITDEPQFKYRGMHLDVSRHMFSVDFIKKYIDAMALLKMNTFHWHLTDDQGWRIEIKKYPRLQEISAFRDETLVGHYSDQPHQFDGKKYGGYYTQDEVKEIVVYAQARHVTVIPEIEMPGHAQAAIAAYPELGCTGEQVEVAKKWGVFEEIYCPNQKTFAFLEDVLDEVLELFPSKYIHIGGDEAPKTRWKDCSHCQALIKKEGLKDEHELQSYFITKMEKYLNSKGRQIIGWDEILEGGLAPNATVMSWRGTKGAIAAAQQSHDVVMTPTSHCYFDYYQSDNENEPLAIGGFLPLEKVYGFNPIPEELTIEESQYVLGAQGNIWTEYIPTETEVEYMAFPRMLAMSEVVWSNLENKNYDDFVSRLENFNKRLDVLEVNYSNHLYEVEGVLISDDDKISYHLSKSSKNHHLVYSTDGNKPVYILYDEYESPIIVNKSMTIKAATFNSEGNRLSKIFKQSINFHKAVGNKITINVEPHKAYSGSGKNGLINGVSGSDSRYGDKEWLGFWGDDLEIIIDLDEETDIKSIETRFYNGQGQWIYSPKQVAISFDDKDYKMYNLDDLENLLVDFKLDINSVKAKKIKLKIPSYGIIPEGLQGAGQKAWTFIDEIIIE